MSEDIISDLVQLDVEARKAVENAEQERDEVKVRITQETADVRKTYMERARHRIECMRETAQRDSEEQIDGLGKKFDAARTKLDESFAQNETRWVEELVKRCTGA